MSKASLWELVAWMASGALFVVTTTWPVVDQLDFGWALVLGGVVLCWGVPLAVLRAGRPSRFAALPSTVFAVGIFSLCETLWNREDVTLELVYVLFIYAAMAFLTLDSEPEDASGSGSDSHFPWWGFVGFLIALRFCTTLDPNRPSFQPSGSGSGRAPIPFGELNRGRADPSRYETMDIEVMQVAGLMDEAGAQWELGRRHLEGDGVEADVATAGRWLERAAENGHERAQQKLDELSGDDTSTTTTTTSRSTSTSTSSSPKDPS